MKAEIVELSKEELPSESAIDELKLRSSEAASGPFTGELLAKVPSSIESCDCN